MWPGQDNRVYLQGHVVIPNDWGNVSTNGETTTTTDDTTDKDGGDDAECCNLKDCCEKIGSKQLTSYIDWMGQWDEAGYYSGYEHGKNRFDCNEALNDYRLAKCEYNLTRSDEQTKSNAAFRMRYAACVARWAGCKWASHPETTDEYDPVRASYARNAGGGHGFYLMHL